MSYAIKDTDKDAFLDTHRELVNQLVDTVAESLGFGIENNPPGFPPRDVEQAMEMVIAHCGFLFDEVPAPNPA